MFETIWRAHAARPQRAERVEAVGAQARGLERRRVLAIDERVARGVVERASERFGRRRVRTGEQLAVQVRRTRGDRPVADAHPLPVRGPELLVGRVHPDRVGDRAQLREVRVAQVAAS